ncbi:MAG: GTP cyclohydrolase I FolE2 [Gammaproteobacteria bacterium HGW-Gammaproteobacteria-8]|nr:MAG: GTP cyclohydrolase I FolE2 [Gammaproteobacteria bacterium HGW-Gammaproteobacteria-8]
MPDIASQPHNQLAGKLDWVGMNHIEVPVQIPGADGQTTQCPARISAFVNLNDSGARGIHMSRLYLHLDRALADHPLTPAALRHLLRDFLDSHEDLSSRALIRVDFEYQTRRPALASDNSGWRSYPFSIIATLEGRQFGLELSYEVTYSSTCPCSAALARQLIQQQFERDFGASGKSINRDEVLRWLGTEQGIMATPHSQRSVADIRLRLTPTFEAFPFGELVDLIEGALKTPVQTAVKREDEQEFARLNGQNLMFCEDAGRRVRKALESDERILDYWARCSHYESLHPHDAVSIVTKGVAGGYAPIDSHR